MVAQIDVDGTIDRAPEFFSWLTQALRRDGHTVLIVTSRTTSPENLKVTAEELRAWGITYDRLFLSPSIDDLDQQRLPPGLQPAHRLFIAKPFVAEDYRVDVLFDDDGIVSGLFKTYLPSVTVFRPIHSR